MKSYRLNAIMVGALFVLTMLAGMVDVYFIAPVLKTPLANFYPHALQMKMGALMILLMAIGIVGIAAAFYPVVRKHSEMVAVTYLSLRAVECVLLILGSLSYLFLIGFSQEFIRAGAPAGSVYLSISDMVIRMRYSAYQLSMVVLGINSLFLCWLLFKTKLIPRFIAGLGFTGYVLLLASALLDMMGLIDTVNGAGVMLYIPGLVFELILLPIWLISKGFNQKAGNAGDVHSGGK